MTQLKEAPQCDFCLSREHSVFSDLKNNELQHFSEKKQSEIYKKGQVVFNEGEHANGIYCIHKGKVKVYKLGDEGREQIVRLVKGGDVLGYRALLSGETFNAYAEALEESIICFIPKSHLFDNMEQNPELSMRFMRLLCGDLKGAEERLVKLAQKKVRERVAEMLLILRSTFGNREDESINIELTREDLANIVGTATEPLIRLLSEFKKEGIVELNGKYIKILDPDRLSQIGDALE